MSVLFKPTIFSFYIRLLGQEIMFRRQSEKFARELLQPPPLVHYFSFNSFPQSRPEIAVNPIYYYLPLVM